LWSIDLNFIETHQADSFSISGLIVANVPGAKTQEKLMSGFKGNVPSGFKGSNMVRI